MSIHIAIDPRSLAEEEAALIDGVDVIVTFSDGSAYRYFGVDMPTAMQLVKDPALYNTYLRGNQNSERIS